MHTGLDCLGSFYGRTEDRFHEISADRHLLDGELDRFLKGTFFINSSIKLILEK